MQHAFLKLNNLCDPNVSINRLSNICKFYLSKCDLIDANVKKGFISKIILIFEKTNIKEPVFSKNFELLVIDTFKDPRKSPGTWIGYDKEKSIYLSWKLSQAMGAFFDLLDKSCENNPEAKRMWQPRRLILKALYDQGHILEAWFLLGPQALRDSSKFLPEGFQDFAKLKNTDNERTIILLRIGNHIVAEGTFQFAFRIWKAESSRAPKLYQDTYSELDLTGLGEDRKVTHNTENWVRIITPVLEKTLGITLK
jgi:hypothetical protein